MATRSAGCTSSNAPSSKRPRARPDNQILAAIIELRDQNPARTVILVTKDINLRIKASIYGIVAEDYENDRALDDLSCCTPAPPSCRRTSGIGIREVRSWTEHGRTFYEVERREDEDWYPNQCLYLPGENDVELRVLRLDGTKRHTGARG